MHKRILVIAPHHDDEVLGVGGTIARFAAEGVEVFVAILTKGYAPEFAEDDYEIDCQEALEAHEILCVKETIFVTFPAARLDTIPHLDVSKKLVQISCKVKPDILFIPFIGDIHLDHQRVFLSALVASRADRTDAPKSVYAYETLSETNWNAPYITPGFIPNVFVDISAHLETKIQAMQKYVSQIQPFPNERSEDSLRALATLRGSTVGYFAAEAFVLLRRVI